MAHIQLGLHKHVRKKPARLLLPSLVISMMYLRERKKNCPPGRWNCSKARGQPVLFLCCALFTHSTGWGAPGATRHASYTSAYWPRWLNFEPQRSSGFTLDLWTHSDKVKERKKKSSQSCSTAQSLCSQCPLDTPVTGEASSPLLLQAHHHFMCLNMTLAC